MAYHVLTKGQEATVKEIDKDCRNKWNFKWLDEEVMVEPYGRVRLGDSIAKINVSGKARCEWCHSLLSYKGKGLSTLREHVLTEGHKHHLKTRKSNYGLGSFVAPTNRSTPKMFSIFTQPKLNQKNDSSSSGSSSSNPYRSSSDNSDYSVCKPTTTTVPLRDRSASMEAMLLAFIAEHSLPLSLAPQLVNLTKACSRDPQALSQVSLSKTSAAYKIKHGLSKTITDALIFDLQSTPFSLNIDEATSSNTKKVLCILVSYFKENEVRVHHLASLEIPRASSAIIYDAICALFEDNNIPWNNLVSILCDSCAVMRGAISGVETRIRQEKAPHLLNVDGDSCHHMQIIAKKFCSGFDGGVQKLFSDLYVDFKWCGDHKAYLKEICELLGVPYTVPQLYSTTRWLSCYDRTLDTMRMKNAYLFFYFSFLSSVDREAYRPMMKQIFEDLKTPFQARKRLYTIMEILSDRKMTKDGKERKERIVTALFYKSKETALQLEVYSSVLQLFKEYVCLFQTTEPMVHKLNDMQTACVKKFLSLFIRPEKLPNKLTETQIHNPSFHLPLKDIYIGHPEEKADNSFRKKVLDAYISAADIMLKKLPLNSPTFLALSALDPTLRQHTVVKQNLDKLGNLLKHLLTHEEVKQYSNDVRSYVNDDSLGQFEDGGRLEKWWTGGNVVAKYPALSKIAAAAITIFHGPQVESTFSVMSRVVTKQTASMNIPMLNSIQAIKYELRANNTSAIDYFERKQPQTDPVNLQLCRNLRASYSVYEQERQEANKKQELKRKASERALKMNASNQVASVYRNKIKKAKQRQMEAYIRSQANCKQPAKKKRKIC